MAKPENPLRTSLMLLFIGMSMISGWAVYGDGGEIARVHTSEPVDADVTSISSEARQTAAPYSGQIYYAIHVEFEYEYQGETYTSQNLIGGSLDRAPTEARAGRLLSEYEAGTSTTAYVSWIQPGKAYLIQPDGPLNLRFGATAWLLAGIFVLWRGLKDIWIRYH